MIQQTMMQMPFLTIDAPSTSRSLPEFVFTQVTEASMIAAIVSVTSIRRTNLQKNRLDQNSWHVKGCNRFVPCNSSSVCQFQIAKQDRPLTWP